MTDHSQWTRLVRVRRIRLSLAAVFLLTVYPLQAQGGGTSLPDAPIGRDGIGFKYIRIHWSKTGEAMQFVGTFDSRDQSRWDRGLKFRLYIRGEEVTPPSGKWCGVYEVLTLRSITTTEPLSAPVRVVERGSRCEPNGTNVDSFESAEAELRAAELERTRRAQLAGETKRVQKRARQLARLPRLKPVADQLPLAADQRCLQQTVTAMRMEGLEKRKLIHELVSYGCVDLIRPNVPVTVLQRRPSALLIEVMDGDAVGKRGWVLPEWIRQPAASTLSKP